MAELDKLNRVELWEYATEIISKSFIGLGFDVNTMKVNNGLVLNVKSALGKQSQIRVKSIRFTTNYVFVGKDGFDINQDNLYMALVLFDTNYIPSLFLIPASAWLRETVLFRDRKYKKEGYIYSSKAEWGLNVSNANRHLLTEFAFAKVVSGLT